ncbi:hypothetical protein C6356_30190 [Bacillus wiedmannii]|nr:hypothetical protein C6356_30190 [Bacillus wiedmannii]
MLSSPLSSVIQNDIYFLGVKFSINTPLKMNKCIYLIETVVKIKFPHFCGSVARSFQHLFEEWLNHIIRIYISKTNIYYASIRNANVKNNSSMN